MSRLRQRYAMAGANAVEQHGLPTECDRHVLIEHPLGQGSWDFLSDNWFNRALVGQRAFLGAEHENRCAQRDQVLVVWR